VRRCPSGAPSSSSTPGSRGGCLLPSGARPELLGWHGGATQEQLLRARVLALFLCSGLAVYGRHEGLARLEREAVAGLERTTLD
jgi:hypothetical protein